MTLYHEHFSTPLGTMEVTATDKAVTAIHFVEQTQAVNTNTVTAMACRQLREYFAGERQQFSLPLAPEGTDFQQSVWRALSTVAYGDTCCYADIARKIDNARAVRAVGAANGRNPLTIVVPCHRIIGQDGSLTGYASGIERKAWLLNHESPGLF